MIDDMFSSGSIALTIVVLHFPEGRASGMYVSKDFSSSHDIPENSQYKEPLLLLIILCSSSAIFA
jgi:hypothetical protein